jgi:hypothetical protein
MRRGGESDGERGEEEVDLLGASAGGLFLLSFSFAGGLKRNRNIKQDTTNH